MIASAQVKSQVVDITKPRASFPKHITVDANVLYFVHYPNFTPLRAAGGKAPLPYQTKWYPAWWSNALKAGTKFFATPATMGEFVRLTEYAELEGLWLTTPATPAGSKFSPLECKKARYAYAARLATFRQQANTILRSVRKTVDLLPKFGSESDELDKAIAQWIDSAGDFLDALLVANGKLVRFLDVLSDDVDLLTFDAITVYTANLTSINAASSAGKLV